MKNSIILVTLAVVFFSCKKDLSVCKNYKEITGRVGTIDPASIQITEMRDTLLKYPQLEVSQLYTNSFISSMYCNVYYKNLQLFTDQYTVFKNMTGDSLYTSGTLFQNTLSISLEPKVKYEDAIKEAHNYINLDHSCTAYQLGLYNKNRWSNVPANYKLAWKISDVEKPYIYVIIDAIDKSYLYSERGGVYWTN